MQTAEKSIFFKIPAWAFLTLEMLFFAFFVICDHVGQPPIYATVARFCIILFAFLYATWNLFAFGKNDPLFRRRLFLSLAMLMTFVSDIFLMIPVNITLGTCTFVVVQILHALEIKRNRKDTILRFSLRFGFSVVAIIVMALIGELNPLYAAVAFYAPQLVGNLLEHFVGIFQAKEREEKRRSLLLTVAFALFFACDLCVALSYRGVPRVGVWIWIFYAPSQMMIALSCEKLRFRKPAEQEKTEEKEPCSA